MAVADVQSSLLVCLHFLTCPEFPIGLSSFLDRTDFYTAQVFPYLYLGQVNGPIPKANNPIPNAKSKQVSPTQKISIKVKDENKHQISAVVYCELCVVLLLLSVAELRNEAGTAYNPGQFSAQ